MTPDEAIQVVAGIVQRGDEILITQRPNDSHLGGLWEFPGGKVEEGESREESLAREIQEELGVEVSVGELYFETTHAYPDRRVHVSFFKCALAGGAPKCLRVTRLCWVRPSELSQFALPEANGALIDKLIRES